MQIDLAGKWQLSSFNGALQAPMELPGDVISALHMAGLIVDPYFGRNEYGLRWICETGWKISRDFDLPDADFELVVDGLDTVAKVWLNGALVLSAANSFRQHRANLSAAARPGKNLIEIHFPSVVAEANARQAALPFPIPYQKSNCPIPNGNMLRKPQCDFGWDWNIALAPVGLLGRITLQRPAPYLEGVVITQAHSAGHVDVTLTAHIARHAGPVTFRLCGQSVDADGGTATLRIEDPDLWWPAGFGPQTLHDLTIEFAGHSVTRCIGLRALDLVTEPDNFGLGFKFRVNGHDIFARGANWIPADALGGRITPDGVRDLLQSAVDANMNMIRIWGGGRYEPDWFYDLCDEFGLMVWQDYMFACHLYTSTPEFLAEVAGEVRDVTLRIGHHASLALWCGDNELLGALTWFEESRNDRDRYLVNYDRLNRTIETALKDVAPLANWWPSSPSPGPMSFGDAWHNDSSGDMHFWSVWHEGRDFDHYRDVAPRFCSEFGFQSYPSMDVISRFADPVDWNIAAPVLESHQKNAGGNARIAETMFRYFRFPVSFPDFVWLSQVQQGLAIKTAVTHWRSLKPHCMGTLIWQLNDTWPVCSWSSLDHGGGWKLLHYMARDFFAPVTVIAVPTPTGFTLRGVNDSLAATEMTLTVSALSMDGCLRALAKTTVSVGSNAAQDLAEVGPIQPGELLYWHWQTAAGQGADHLAPLPYKSYDLPDAEVTLRVSGDEITLTSTAVSLFATAIADQPGRFSKNAVTLLPNQPQTLIFMPATPGALVQFSFRDLRRATYGDAPRETSHPDIPLRPSRNASPHIAAPQGSRRIL